MSIRQAVSNLTTRVGAVYTLRSDALGAGVNGWTAGTAASVFSTCRARERNYEPQQIRGGIQEHDTLIVIDASTCLAVPKPGDKIALGEFSSDTGADWRQIVNVSTPLVNGETVVYRCQTRA